MPCVFALCRATVLLVALAGLPARAESHVRAETIATPVGTAACVPPPPATPTPTPWPTAPSLVAEPTPLPGPDPDALVDPLLDGMVAAAAANLEACWNAGAWDAVAGIVTPRFLETALGITALDAPSSARALAALDLGPIRIVSLGPVSIWHEGRGAVEVLYLRGRGKPIQAIAARWFFVAERGVAAFDEEVALPPPPLGDRVTLGFAIADDAQPLQWASPDGGQSPTSPVLALHGANRGFTAHTFHLEDASGEAIGILTLPAWSQGDLVLLDLPPGTYRLTDPAIAGSSLELVITDDRLSAIGYRRGAHDF
jgi:hypothetical protein